MPTRSNKESLGHTSLSVTERYLVVTDQNKSYAVGRLHTSEWNTTLKTKNLLTQLISLATAFLDEARAPILLSGQLFLFIGLSNAKSYVHALP